MSADLLNAPAPDTKDVAAEFRRLAEWWSRETAYLSDLVLAFEHPAYREVVALGPSVVPVLLREQEQKPSWWIYALHEITGANPIRPDDRGNLSRMSEAWVKWGQDNQII